MTPNKNNRLRNEKSPYLLQHASNPVDWFPWGPEAFAKAKLEKKPIFLSIGYSTCHWCHVMEHESFADEEVATLMNKFFVSIKVDREERPDIDNTYMKVAQLISGVGGWPLNIITTPEKKPFFAATYIPKDNKHGRLGMMGLIPQINNLWETSHDDIVKSASDITTALCRISPKSSESGLAESTLKAAFEQIEESYDHINGGIGQAPKFPTPHNMLFLLRYWKRTGSDKALEMVEKMLISIRRGGIYDHIGYGVHRYSTDSVWLVPHFEKMLYDQAMLAMAYIETYQATGNNEYKKSAKEIFHYVLRDMTSNEGAFFTAEDADSEGEEGLFYLWKEDEVRKILNKDDAELAIKVFNIEKEGNFIDQVIGHKTGHNIFHLTNTLDEIAKDLNMGEYELATRIELVREILFSYREKRTHPYKDDKVLTDWNGLMIAALAKGAQAFNDVSYAEDARRAASFILNKMRTEDGRLLHRYRGGEAMGQGNINDYSFFIWGLIELYHATFDIDYLKSALDFNSDMINHFWDDGEGGFFFTADDAEELLTRQKEIHDGAIPSGNSVAMLNLLKLGKMTADEGLEDKAVKLGQAFSEQVSNAPSAYTQLLTAVDFVIGPSYEVVIAGDSSKKETKLMSNKLMERFIPNKVVVLRPTESELPEITELTKYSKYHTTIDGKPTAYVCENFNCRLPTTDIEKMFELLNSK